DHDDSAGEPAVSDDGLRFADLPSPSDLLFSHLVARSIRRWRNTPAIAVGAVRRADLLCRYRHRSRGRRRACRPAGGTVPGILAAPGEFRPGSAPAGPRGLAD